mgnify:CR=1 FL=1
MVDLICEWEPCNALIITAKTGKVSFENMIDGVTFKEESDEKTGFREKVIIDTKDKTKNPSIIVNGKEQTKGYNMPVGEHLAVEEGTKLKAGQIMAKIPRTMGKLRDITGGLPRVTELFEARNPSNPAVVSAIDGVVTYGGIKRGNREIFIESKDGMIFDVKGLSQPSDRIIAFVRYIPCKYLETGETKRKGFVNLYNFNARYSFLPEKFPKYLF